MEAMIRLALLPRPNLHTVHGMATQHSKSKEYSAQLQQNYSSWVAIGDSWKYRWTAPKVDSGRQLWTSVCLCVSFFPPASSLHKTRPRIQQKRDGGAEGQERTQAWLLLTIKTSKLIPTQDTYKGRLVVVWGDGGGASFKLDNPHEYPQCITNEWVMKAGRWQSSGKGGGGGTWVDKQVGGVGKAGQTFGGESLRKTLCSSSLW